MFVSGIRANALRMFISQHTMFSRKIIHRRVTQELFQREKYFYGIHCVFYLIKDFELKSFFFVFFSNILYQVYNIFLSYNMYCM